MKLIAITCSHVNFKVFNKNWEESLLKWLNSAILTRVWEQNSSIKTGRVKGGIWWEVGRGLVHSSERARTRLHCGPEPFRAPPPIVATTLIHSFSIVLPFCLHSFHSASLFLAWGTFSLPGRHAEAPRNIRQNESPGVLVLLVKSVAFDELEVIRSETRFSNFPPASASTVERKFLYWSPFSQWSTSSGSLSVH